MSILSKLFGRKQETDENGTRIGGMEDFMQLIRVYYQATMAANLGITNLAVLPDLRIFKQTLHVATVNNRLGLGEKNKCKKMLEDLYDISEDFFKEIDLSIKKNCRNANDVRNYLFLFSGFSQDLMMLMGNLMQWKLRVPGFMRKALRAMTEKAVNDVMTKNEWKDNGVRKAVFTVREYQRRLGYSQQWMTEYVYRVVTLAKKEPKPKDTEEKKKP